MIHLFIYLFIYLFLAALGLRFCVRAFSSCGERGPLFITVRGPLTIAASPVGSTSSRRAGSVIVAHGPSCSVACGIFSDQGSNPCPLRWQADSQPLCHQGSPIKYTLTSRYSEHNLENYSNWVPSSIYYHFKKCYITFFFFFLRMVHLYLTT